MVGVYFRTLLLWLRVWLFFLFPLEGEGIGCRRNREFRATPLVRCFAAGLLLFLDDVTASPHTRFEMSDLANL